MNSDSDLLELVLYPDPLLNQESEPVESVDDKILHYINRMIKTMHALSGIGLAAVQTGLLKRIVIIDISAKTAEYLHTQHNMRNQTVTAGYQNYTDEITSLINPVIIHKSDNHITYPEGCLSFPGARSVNVERAKDIIVKYLNTRGEVTEIKATGILSICLQHEIDHIHGITLAEHLTGLKKQLFIKRQAKLKKQTQDES